MNTVLALNPDEVPAVAAVVADTHQPANIREAAAKAVGGQHRRCKAVAADADPRCASGDGDEARGAPASRPEGAKTLLDAVERNTILPRLLLEPTVKDKLAAAKIKDLDTRIANLTKNLAPASEQLDKLITAKRRL